MPAYQILIWQPTIRTPTEESALFYRITAGLTRLRARTLGPTTRGRSAALKYLPLQINFGVEQDSRRGISPDTQGQEHTSESPPPKEGNPDSLQIHSQPPPVRPSQILPKTPLFIIINHTHMHRHIIRLQCVDLNNT